MTVKGTPNTETSTRSRPRFGYGLRRHERHPPYPLAVDEHGYRSYARPRVERA